MSRAAVYRRASTRENRARLRRVELVGGFRWPPVDTLLALGAGMPPSTHPVVDLRGQLDLAIKLEPAVPAHRHERASLGPSTRGTPAREWCTGTSASGR